MTTDAPAQEAGTPHPSAPRDVRGRRAARWHWAVGIVLALGFHVALVAFTRVPVVPKPRVDVVDHRITWLGDRVFLDGENSLRYQVLTLFPDDPLFLVTSRNYAGSRPSTDEMRPPGQIFSRFEPVLVMPVDRSPPGLVTAPGDRVDPVVAVQSYRFPYLSRFARADPVERAFEARRARLEVRSNETGKVVLTQTIPVDSNREVSDVWPDWRPFEAFVTVSQSGGLSEPLMLGGSGSDTVDRFMRDYLRRSMRLDLRLGPGNYRISIGP